jgi:ribosome-binding ATPase YchF (GTP1/OBG family)
MAPLIGIVGKPSAGKSTFFSASTMQMVEISPRPFTTIKPNVGIAYVRVEDIGKEFNVTSQPREGFIKGIYRFVPIQLIDVAGLIPGSHEGKGLGNQFLNDLNQAEGLIHVIDLSGSTDEQGRFIGYGKRDPELDIKFLENELDYWYKDIIDRNIDKMSRIVRAGKKDEEAISEILSVFRVNLNLAKETLEKYGQINEWKNTFEIANFLRKNTKKIVIAGNKFDLPYAEENYNNLKTRYDIIPVCAEAELALKKASKAGLIDYTPGEKTFDLIANLSDEQKKALEVIKSLMQKIDGTGVQKTLEHIVFDVLNYIAVFPAGSKLVDKQGRVLPDCFLMPKNSTLKDFAEKIHSDIAKGLLYGIDVRTKIKLSKNYILKHRDAIELFSTAK